MSTSIDPAINRAVSIHTQAIALFDAAREHAVHGRTSQYYGARSRAVRFIAGEYAGLLAQIRARVGEAWLARQRQRLPAIEARVEETFRAAPDEEYERALCRYEVIWHLVTGDELRSILQRFIALEAALGIPLDARPVTPREQAALL